MMEWHIVWLGFAGSLAAGMATSIGALGIFPITRLSEKAEVTLMSWAAGIMLSAVFFSLLLPAIEYAESLAQNRLAAVGVVVAGIVTGVAVLLFLHRSLPHEHHFTGREGPMRALSARIWLFVIAITIHNIPEGMTVGVGFASEEAGRGVSLALGIGIQNIAEGLAVAAVLLAVHYSRTRAFLVASLTGLVEPLGGLFSSSVVWLAEPLMPWMMGFAAGAMLFIISDEIIPETHRKGYKNLATLSLLTGFVVMMLLDVVTT